MYGAPPDLRIVNRFLSEKQGFSQFECVTYFDIIGRLRGELLDKGELIVGRIVLGSSFAAYLLGAADENPLPAHYRCPVCKRVEFVEGTCVFDMPRKECFCGALMVSDGFDIPFETYLPYVKKGIEFDHTNYKEIYDDISSHITPSLCEAAARCKSMEAELDLSISDIDLSNKAVIQQYLSGNFRGMPRNLEKFMKETFPVAQPQNCAELIKLVGLAHGTQAWRYNAEELLTEGVCSLAELPTTFDEVFLKVRDAMRKRGYHDTGFAYEVATKTKKGYYFENGMDGYTASALRALGLGGWFLGYILRCRYLSNKALAVTELKYSVINSYYHILKEKKSGEQS